MLSRATALLARRPAAVGLAALLVTALLAWPLLTMAPTGFASTEPGGPSFTARDVLGERLAPEIATEFFVVEAAGAAPSVDAPDGPQDVLDPAVLREVHARVSQLRDSRPDLLETVLDPATGRLVDGTLTIADLADEALAATGGLDGADDATLRRTVSGIVDAIGVASAGLSVDAERADDGTWSAPALSLVLLLDNDQLGNTLGGASIGGDDSAREEVLREVRDVLRGGEAGSDVPRDVDGELVVHGIAIDTNLTAAEQGEAAGPFIGFVVLLTLLLVGIVLRSYWAVALVGSGIAALMVWLLGLSNLVGLEQDQILSTIVPIALVSFGVDAAFHAFGRVREERDQGRDPRTALAAGLAGVGGALLLALASDGAAFLSNAFAGIESIVQFGMAASFGLASAFLLLGVVAPTAELAVLDRTGTPATGRRATAARATGAALAASAAMGAVLLTVFVSPELGVALTLLHPVVFVLLPAWWQGRDRVPADAGVVLAEPQGPGRVATALGRGVVATARRAGVVLPVVALVTALATVAALRVETAFDVEDFFSADTDFVAALDALDERIGGSGGETTSIVVTTDLRDPAAVAALATVVDDLRAHAGVFATDDDGTTFVDGGVVDVVRDAVTVPAAREAVEATGVRLLDADGDGIPEDPAALAAVLEVAATDGLPLDATTLLWSPAQITPRWDLGDTGASDDVTRLDLQLPGSREVTVIAEATAEIDPIAARLAAELDELVPGSDAVATGSAIVRQRSLDAVSRALLVSLPLAVLACLVVALAAMRSVRFALVAITPILLVVPWLYGALHLLGFRLNLVTGTIGAISIGIGIDFAIHLVQRFREESVDARDVDDALRATAEGTGLALLASAASSVLGFGVLALAPMPLFASYGLLTSMMVAMALIATLLVLPALLRVTEPRRGGVDAPAALPDAALAR